MCIRDSLGIGALVIGDEVSLVVKLIYIVPLIISSITILILYFKAKSSDFSDEKTMELMLNFILLETICICFLSSYFYQYFLFKDFTQIDYLKNMGFVLVCIGLITILTLLDAPKKLSLIHISTKAEYEAYEWNKRFSARRREGVKQFWNQERERIIKGESTTRNWTTEQIQDILNGRTPKYDVKPIQGHHSYLSLIHI